MGKKDEPIDMDKHNAEVIQAVREIHRMMVENVALTRMTPAAVLEGIGAYFVTCCTHFGLDRKGAMLILDHAADNFLIAMADKEDPVAKFAAAIGRGDFEAAVKVLATALDPKGGKGKEALAKAAREADARADEIIRAATNDESDKKGD